MNKFDIPDQHACTMCRRVAVLGAGSWGTALAIKLGLNGHDVRLWARRPEAAAEMQETRRNRRYLAEGILPDSVRATADFEAALADTDLWIVAVPSQSVRSIAQDLDAHATEGVRVVSVAKGIENGTLLTTTQVLQDVLTNVPREHLGVLYGPSHAEEAALGLPTAVVASAYATETAEVIQDAFMSSTFRVYVNPDVIGVEIGGSVKNVLAIATGMCDGVGFGDNARAGLITRGLAEMKRLGLALGANPLTFAGLAGIGDIVVTCTSGLSRNRYLGEQIGKGRTLEDIEAEMTMVAEGVRTTLSVRELSQQHGIEMPITEAVYAILFEGKRPYDAVVDLMGRTAKRENWLPDTLQQA